VSTTVDRQGPQGHEPERHGPHTVTVTVFAPRTTDPRIFTWPQTMKVGEAASQAAHDFGYEPGTPSFQNADGEVLDRDKPLVAAGVRDGDELELVDVGGGV
jgi:hypothetical protein